VTWIAIGLGALAVVVALRMLPARMRRPPHARENYRGREVLGTAGSVLIVPLAIGAALAQSAEDHMTKVVLTMLGGGVAFAAFGYADDVYGSRHAGGFVGHARELMHGRLTTGAVKALGGGVVGLATAWGIGRRGPWILIGGAIIALSANLTNLLDVRPGRALKIWLPCSVALTVADRRYPIVAALIGGALVFLVYELREKVMLGDTGAGLLGGTLGIAATATLSPSVLWLLLGVLVVFTIASEVVSFTKVIESVPPLRWADRLGRAR
jgi:UDP-N-acetylmuramyl pentapeptide phosphotransferase/UDP-N-acetylglucosamine-1-phosphate transferase